MCVAVHRHQFSRSAGSRSALLTAVTLHKGESGFVRLVYTLRVRTLVLAGVGRVQRGKSRVSHQSLVSSNPGALRWPKLPSMHQAGMSVLGSQVNH